MSRYRASGTPIFSICLVYNMYIPGICRCHQYAWYIRVSESVYIQCISYVVDIHGIHQQTQVILCQIIFFPLYYTHYVTIISYCVTINSIIFFRVFGQLCHIMSNFRKQLLFQLFQYYYFNFFFA